MTRTKLYNEFADWWPLLSDPADYAEEAGIYSRTIAGNSSPTAQTVLELGSGGGNNASHLKAHFTLTLVDVSPAMLNVSAILNPECEHLVGDMRAVRLNRSFDCVFVHDAVAYMTSRDDLAAATRTAFVHCRPGGMSLFVPDGVVESFRPGTSMGGHDGADGRSLRYLEWISDRDPSDEVCEADFAYLLRDPDGSTVVHHDHHTFGLFTRATWINTLESAGFDVQVVPYSLSDVADRELEMFVCKRPR